MIYTYVRLDPLLWHGHSKRAKVDAVLIAETTLAKFNVARAKLKEEPTWAYEKFKSKHAIICRGLAWFDELQVVTVTTDMLNKRPTMGIY